jgi:hypothetical protein
MAQEKGVSVETISQIKAGDPVSLKGIRAANWFNFALGLLCMILCAVAFRGTGIVGNTPDQLNGHGRHVDYANGPDEIAADAPSGADASGLKTRAPRMSDTPAADVGAAEPKAPDSLMSKR